MPIAVFSLGVLQGDETPNAELWLCVCPLLNAFISLSKSVGWPKLYLPTIPYHRLTRVGDGDISAHRCGLIGSCSSSVLYSV